MDDVEFQQDRQLAHETLILRNAQLFIVAVGSENGRIIQLTDISPAFETDKKCFKRFYLGPALIALPCAFGGWKLVIRQDELVMPFFFGVLLISLALGLLFGMRFEPVELARVRDTHGKVLFELYRPLKSAYKFDEFMKALAERIAWSHQFK
jgi:hypothetical protein